MEKREDDSKKTIYCGSEEGSAVALLPCAAARVSFHSSQFPMRILDISSPYSFVSSDCDFVRLFLLFVMSFHQIREVINSQ
jgi:hypothetical protein